MRHLPLILLATALCAGEQAPPVTQPDKRPPWPSPEEMFQKADADKDGKVTLAELTAAIEARMKSEREAIFAKMDSNGDGQVSKEEFLAFEPAAPPGAPGEDGKKKRRGPDPAEVMKRHDKNGDGVLTIDEMKRLEKGDRPKDAKESKDGLLQ
jgi:Ca2+-binding EF-hand superfamily protein